MASGDFWDNQEQAQKVIAQVNTCKAQINPLQIYQKRLEDALALCELAEEFPEDDELLEQLQEVIDQLKADMEALEITGFLNGPHDTAPAIISIHAGAGGTESCDWADMLFRMYTRWAQFRGFEVEIQDLQPGDQAGLSRVTFRLAGPYAYGYCKAERGVHRLVRISPFDTNKRRHTSFACVDVVAEIQTDDEMDIPEADLRIDTYRASGASGQHVNKTESAIRITHLPTGIVVTCQNDRSQQKNRQAALKTLKSKLLEKMMDDKRSAMEKF